MWLFVRPGRRAPSSLDAAAKQQGQRSSQVFESAFSLLICSSPIIMTLAGVFFLSTALSSLDRHVQRAGVLAFAIAALWFMASIVVSARWRNLRRDEPREPA
jgi:hypothetical protein